MSIIKLILLYDKYYLSVKFGFSHFDCDVFSFSVCKFSFWTCNAIDVYVCNIETANIACKQTVKQWINRFNEQGIISWDTKVNINNKTEEKAR